MERFNEADESDIRFLIEASSSKNTKLATSNWLRIYKQWATARGKEVEMEKLEPSELNKTLEIFFAEVRKTNSSEYEPDSLKVMLAALDRYLKGKDYPVSIIKGREFSSSKSVLEEKHDSFEHKEWVKNQIEHVQFHLLKKILSGSRKVLLPIALAPWYERCGG